ncbi:unnamed protein product [Effrenium voratum]|uniref:Uncharacterized protein n=1 Tax=Effrenium voratum TaxID=2562239 RepID=A0AA36IA10_9DINO|nr:unnamed protein product [Effrenium voratum]
MLHTYKLCLVCQWASQTKAEDAARATCQVLVDLCALAMLTKQTIESSGGPKASGKLVSCIEYFAGKARVAKAFKKTRRASRAFDYMRSGRHNICENTGFMASVVALLSLRFAGLAHYATVCTSFCWVNRATNKRSKCFPLGTDRGYVAAGSVMGGRTAAMCLLTWALGSAFSLEQPKSSTMEFLASWQFVIDFFKQRGDCLKAHFLNMGSFLAPSKKPTVLYTVFNMEPFTQLPTPATQRRRRGRAPVTRQYTDGAGKRRCTGDAGLKDSQAYTPEFGRAMLAWWIRNKDDLKTEGRQRFEHAVREIRDASVAQLAALIMSYRSSPGFRFPEAQLDEFLDSALWPV